MSRIIIVGGGVVGLALALMLDKQGHEITVLERDPAPPPGTSAGAWESWERNGVMQFRQPHGLLAGGWQVIQNGLPEVAVALAAADAAPHNPLWLMPSSLTDRAPRPDDEKFGTLIAQRPVLEHALAATAEGRIDIRDGGRRGAANAANGQTPPSAP